MGSWSTPILHVGVFPVQFLEYFASRWCEGEWRGWQKGSKAIKTGIRTDATPAEKFSFRVALDTFGDTTIFTLQDHHRVGVICSNL